MSSAIYSERRLRCVNSSGAHIEYIAEDIFRIFQGSRIDPIARRDSQLFYWLLLVVRAIYNQSVTSPRLLQVCCGLAVTALCQCNIKINQLTKTQILFLGVRDRRSHAPSFPQCNLAVYLSSFCSLFILHV